MGVLKEILLLPAAPVRGTVWVAERVLEEAEHQYYNPAVIRQELERVDALRDAGEIDDDEAEEWEDQLLERLVESRHRHGGTEGL